ncbi:MAG: EamA family transporter [Patescibacteria group bacterium]|jgi:drug/metabolite transporter (DMT)-like permease
MISYLYIIIAGILSGIIVFGGQVFANKGLSALEISVIPFAISGLMLLPFVLLKKEFRAKKGILALLILYGIVSAVTIVGQYFSLYFGIPVAIVVLLLYVQPLWTTLICKFGFKEKISRREIFACSIVLLGVSILVNPFRSFGSYNIIGLILATLGGISLSGWIITGSVLSKKGNSPISSQFFGVSFTVLLLVLLMPFLKNLGLSQSLISFDLNFSKIVWLWLVVFSIFAITINQILYLQGVKKVSAVDAGIIMLLEPIVGAILASLFLHQILSVNIVIGGILILVANYMVITKQ